jgi:hypothetical protein
MGEHHAGRVGGYAGLTNTIRSIPIVDPDVTHEIGLVVPHREPMTPLIAALVAEAQRVAITLDRR